MYNTQEVAPEINNFSFQEKKVNQNIQNVLTPVPFNMFQGDAGRRRQERQVKTDHQKKKLGFIRIEGDKSSEESIKFNAEYYSSMISKKS